MIFVTGGTGLIGSHLLYKLLSEGKEVRALKRAASNLSNVRKVFSYYTDEPEALLNKIEWVEGDMLHYFRMERLLKGVTEVYHCAAVISFQAGDRNRMIRNNVEGTANIVNASLENSIQKFCHVSSVSALSHNQDELPTDENSNWVPSKRITAYSESKFFSETEIWRGIEEGLNAVIVNPSVVLGPGNWEAGSSRFFKTIWNGLKFYPKGGTGFVDVNDVVNAMTLLMNDNHFEKCKNQRYLLNSENWSYQKLFYQIADSLQKPRPTVFVPGILMSAGWRFASVYNMLSKKPLPVTRETASSANTTTQYDGNKITRTLNFKYLPINESIKQTASLLLQDMNRQKVV